MEERHSVRGPKAETASRVLPEALKRLVRTRRLALPSVLPSLVTQTQTQTETPTQATT